MRGQLPDYQRRQAEYDARASPDDARGRHRSAVYERHPWLAPSLFDALQRAKQFAYDWLADINALPVSLPWFVPEFERTRRVFGRDAWIDGLEPNRSPLTTLCRYLIEQDLARAMPLEDLFAPNTLDRYVV